MEIEEHHDDHEEEEHHGHEEEHHDDHEEEEAPESTPRTFTGASGSIGARYDFSRTMALVGAFTSSSRAPALEELYAFGPHVGNLAFEVGNSNFDLERINGIDLGVKGRRANAQFNFNLFHYDINNFVFPAFTEEIHDGLRVAEFQQTDARFIGFDGDLALQLARNLWLKTGFGYVDATLTKIDQHAPRIPPFHGRIQIEVPVKNLTVIPEVIWSAKQEKIFQPGETETDSYSVLNLKAQYVLPTTHNVHIFAINAYNLTNKLYRMHTSFIKDLAPEIGRGIKFTYSMRFF